MKEVTIAIDDLQLLPQSPAEAEDAALQLEREFVQIAREEVGLTELAASGLAQALVRGLRKRMGGSELWIPAPSKRARDEMIRREFNGTNLEEVMQRHGVGRSTVYRIARMRPRDEQRARESPNPPLSLGLEAE